MIPQPVRAKGFSIAELVAVMAIVAVSAAISIPAGLSRLRDYQTGEAARTVAGHLAAARREAIQATEPNGLLLRLDGSRQMTLVENRRPGVRDRLSPEGAVRQRFTLPPGYEFAAATDGWAGFVFGADGRIDAITGPASRNFIGTDGLNYVLRIRDTQSSAVSDLLVGRAGRVAVPSPRAPIFPGQTQR